MRALSIPIGMKWSAVVWGFLISCVVATGIDQNYQDFGIRICDQIPEGVRRDCVNAMRKETREGFNTLAISIWVVAAIAVSPYIDKSGK